MRPHQQMATRAVGLPDGTTYQEVDFYETIRRHPRDELIILDATLAAVDKYIDNSSSTEAGHYRAFLSAEDLESRLLGCPTCRE